MSEIIMREVKVKLPPITVQYYNEASKTQATIIAKGIEHKFRRENKWRLKIDDVLLEMAEEVLADLPLPSHTCIRCNGNGCPACDHTIKWNIKD